MVANYTNEFWDKECLEIQSYFGSKKCSVSWKVIKIYVHQRVAGVNLT